MDVHTPSHLRPFPEGTRIASSSGVLADTANQVTQQLSIVRTLFHHNVRFLEPSEKAWIDHILSSSSLLINEFGHLTDSGTEEVGGQQRWMPDSAFFHHMKRLLKDSPRGRDDLTLLLIAAQSLNSAIGLLSCCRDRWEWYQTTKQGHSQNLSDPSVDELSHLMNRRRRRQTLDSNGLVRLTSLHLHRGRPSASERELQVKMVDTPADNWSSILSQNARGGMDNLDRSSRLSLAIVETVEKWRQNAEYALSRTSSLGLAEDFITDRSDGSMSAVEEDVGESSPTPQQQICDRTAIFDSDPIPLDSQTSPAMASRAKGFGPVDSRDMHRPAVNNHHQLTTTSTPSTYHTSHRKPLSSQRHATHSLSTRTSGSTSTNTSAGSTGTSNSASSKSSSTSPNLLRPASISLRNSWGKESVVVGQAEEQIDTLEPDPLRTRTSPIRPPIPEALIPGLKSPSQQQRLLPHRPDHSTSISSSISPWSSQTTLLPQYTHNSNTSIDSSFSQQRPSSEYRISRGRAWLERQAASQV